MSRFNVMPRTIPIPDLDDTSLVVILVDSEGNYTANEITRQAIDLAEPAALGLLLRQLLARLDDLR